MYIMKVMRVGGGGFLSGRMADNSQRSGMRPSMMRARANCSDAEFPRFQFLSGDEFSICGMLETGVVVYGCL